MISEHFARSEFACKCGCGFDTVDTELLDVVENLRLYYGVPVRSNSACRCYAHNKAVGGSKNSQHLIGRADDVVVEGISPALVYKYLDEKYPDTYGIGFYNSFTHIDTRDKKARW
jgi:uncharacterized protein YcbK (DUF882 family)